MTSWDYEVHVVGTLSETVLARIEAEVGDVRASPDPPSVVIRGSVADQSALVGLLDLIHALGLEVSELRHVADAQAESEAQGSSDVGAGTRSR